MMLSETYYKPTQNIMVVVNTESHVMIGTSQDPAYFMTVTALTAEIAAMKNVRATKIVQEFLLENLAIPSNRGVIVFSTVKEEDIGTNDSTVSEEIEKLEAEEKRGVSVRSRQSYRTKRGSTAPGTSETMHLENGKAAVSLPTSSEEFGEYDDYSLEKPARKLSSAGMRLQGKKSFLSFWKKV